MHGPYDFAIYSVQLGTSRFDLVQATMLPLHHSKKQGKDAPRPGVLGSSSPHKPGHYTLLDTTPLVSRQPTYKFAQDLTGGATVRGCGLLCLSKPYRVSHTRLWNNNTWTTRPHCTAEAHSRTAQKGPSKRAGQLIR